jgi:polyisoprenoid-binding protein YceI
MRQIFLIGLFCVVRVAAQIPVDEQSKITFQIRNFGVTVAGTFTGLKGNVQFDPTAPKNCSVNISIDSKTIDTGINLRDNHLKKEDYFNAEVYPTISFVSQNLSVQDGRWKAVGSFVSF